MQIKFWLLIILLILSPALFFSGCASPGGNNTENYAGEPNALKISMRSTTDLNWFNERSHTIAIYVAQAKKPAALAKLKGSADEILKFLEKGKDNKGVTSLQRLNIQPGGMIDEYLDYAPETGAIAIIAAFYYLDPKNNVRVFGLPKKRNKKMQINLVLGKDGVLKATKTQGGKW